MSKELSHKEVMFQSARDVMNLGDAHDEHSVDIDNYAELNEAEFSKADGSVRLAVHGREGFSGVAEDDLPAMSLALKGDGRHVAYEINDGRLGDDYAQQPNKIPVKRVEKQSDGTELTTIRSADPRVFKAAGRLARIADRRGSN